MYSESQIKAIILTAIPTGFLSFLGSSIIIFLMVTKSELKLSVPSRRIFFGLCVYDCIYSVSTMFASFPIPRGQGLWGAVGNIETCEAQGFTIHIGQLGSVLYNCALSIYYVSVIKFSMSENDFEKKVEPICHLLINGYAIVGACFLLATDAFNAMGTHCWINAVPPSCVNDPSQECLRGNKMAYSYRWLLFGYACCASFVIICLNMVLIMLSVFKQEHKTERWRLSTAPSTADKGGGKLSFPLTKLTTRFTGSRENNSKMHSSVSTLSNECFEGGKAHVPRGACLKSEKIQVTKPVSSPKIQQEEIAIRKNSNKNRKSRVSFSIYGVDDSDIEEQSRESSQRRISLTSRSGTTRDPLAFDLQKVRRSLRTESTTSEISSRSTSDNIELKSNKLRSVGASNPSNSRKAIRKSSGHEVMTQALLYILSFLLCWIFSFAGRIIEMQDRPSPYYIMQLARTFNPLQGLFNVLIYCRPHIKALRKRNPEYSWFGAFFETLRNGGDNNAVGQSHRATSNHGKRRSSTKALIISRIEREHLKRMESIRVLKVENNVMYAALKVRAEFEQENDHSRYETLESNSSMSGHDAK